MPVTQTTSLKWQHEHPPRRRLWHGRLRWGRRLSRLRRGRRFRARWIRRRWVRWRWLRRRWIRRCREQHSSSYGNTTSTTQSMLPDLKDIGGGPVTVINPYCYDYWRQPSHFHPVSHMQPAKPAPSSDEDPVREP